MTESFWRKELPRGTSGPPAEPGSGRGTTLNANLRFTDDISWEKETHKNAQSSFASVVDAALGPIDDTFPASTNEQDEFGHSDDPWQLPKQIGADGSCCEEDSAYSQSGSSAYSGSDHATSHSREISTRAKKIRDLYRTRRVQSTPHNGSGQSDCSESLSSPACLSICYEPKSRCADLSTHHMQPTAVSTEQSSLQRTPDDDTSDASQLTESSLSSVMMIAERFPLPRTRHPRRTSRQLLPAKKASEQLAIVVRESLVDSIKKSTRTRISSTGIGAAPLSSVAAGGSAASKAASTSAQRSGAGSEATSSRANQEHTDKVLKGRKMSVQTSEKRPNSAKPLPKVPTNSSYPMAGHTIPAQLQRASISSCLTSGSKETRLEARIELLERENKLLEAALMAVLKTGGKLNGCPCGIGEGEKEKIGIHNGDLPSTDGAKLMTASRPIERSVQASGNAKRSPLSVYLETRALRLSSHTGSPRR